MLSSLAPPSASDKMPLLLTVAAAGLFVAVLLTVQPYSATSHGQAYAKPAHRYIQAALRQDSTKLATLSSSIRAVTWALDAARFHRESLSLWAGATDAWIGAHSGDTTEVFLYPSGETCSTAPI